MLIWDCWRRVWLTKRNKPAWWWVSFLRNFYYHAVARMKPADIYFVLHPLIVLYLSYCWYIVICLLRPSSSSLTSFCSVSLFFVGLKVIGELDTYFFTTMLSFYHMLLDWRGPGLEALSFWLQPLSPSPTFRIPQLTHKKPSLYGWGKAFPPQTAVISVCWQKNLNEEDPTPWGFSLHSSHPHTHMHCKDTHM